MQTEQNSTAIAEQKRDLEIIKEHVVPSYKAPSTEEASEPSQAGVTGKVNIPPAAAPAAPVKAIIPAASAKPIAPTASTVPISSPQPLTAPSKSGIAPTKNPAPGQPMTKPGTGAFKPPNKVSYSASISKDVLSYNSDKSSRSYSRIGKSTNSPIVAPENFISKKDYLNLLSKNYTSTPYIQDLIEEFKGSKYSRGKEFNLSDPLTREELVAFAEYFIKGAPDYQLDQTTPDYCVLYLSTFISDGERVSLDYSQLLYRNLCESEMINKVFHTFDKTTVMFFPQRSVTRDEAYKGIQYLKKEFSVQNPGIIKNVKPKTKPKKIS